MTGFAKYVKAYPHSMMRARAHAHVGQHSPSHVVLVLMTDAEVEAEEAHWDAVVDQGRVSLRGTLRGVGDLLSFLLGYRVARRFIGAYFFFFPFLFCFLLVSFLRRPTS